MPDLTDAFLIEAVARRMCLFYGGNPDECYHGGTTPYWKLYERRAADILRIVVPLSEADVLARQEKK